MSTQTEKGPAAPGMSPPSVSFYFDKRLKAPANFESLTLNDKLVVQVSGEVIRLSSNERIEGDSDQILEIRMDKVEIIKGGIRTMKQAHQGAMAKAEGLMTAKK